MRYEQNRVLREQIGAWRLRFTDDQRRQLAAKAQTGPAVEFLKAQWEFWSRAHRKARHRAGLMHRLRTALIWPL
jgi:hypothetical protein